MDLGADFYSKIILFYYNYFPYLNKKFKFFKYKERKINIKKFGRIATIFLNGAHDEYEILKEILINEEYNIDIEPKLIFDLGSNVGFSVIYFALKYPDVKIYGFEPDPNVFLKLKKNISTFNNVEIFNLAVAGQDGERDFFIYPDKTISSSLTKRLDDQIAIKITSKRVDTLINDLKIDKIDLMKIDVEGAEYEIFSNLKQRKKIAAIIGELHFDLMGATKDDFSSLLVGYNVDYSSANKNKRMFFKAIRYGE